MDKNTLHELLKEGKLSETLMGDKNFKDEAQKILQEEKSDINDEDLMKILKVTEKTLSGDMKSNNEDDLEKAVGGLGSTGRDIARGAIKTVSTFVGGVAGLAVGNITGFVGASNCIAVDPKSLYDIMCKAERIRSAIDVGGLTGTAAGGYGGYRFGKFLCEKLGLKD
jgi:hypothetical protein